MRNIQLTIRDDSGSKAHDIKVAKAAKARGFTKVHSYAYVCASPAERDITGHRFRYLTVEAMVEE